MNAPSAGSGSAAPGVEEELTAALVRAFDREHALRSLAQLVLASLEDDLPVGEVLRRLVEEAVSLLDADGGAYVDGTAVEVVGDLAPGADPALTVGGLAVDPVSEVTVHLGEQGRRVAMLLDEPGSPGADAPGRRGIVLCRIAGAPFDTGEVNLAETVGVAARMVHSVNRLRAEAVVRARAAQELEAAAALAQSSLQRTLPSVPGVHATGMP